MGCMVPVWFLQALQPRCKPKGGAEAFGKDLTACPMSVPWLDRPCSASQGAGCLLLPLPALYLSSWLQTLRISKQ